MSRWGWGGEAGRFGGPPAIFDNPLVAFSISILPIRRIPGRLRSDRTELGGHAVCGGRRADGGRTAGESACQLAGGALGIALDPLWQRFPGCRAPAAVMEQVNRSEHRNGMLACSAFQASTTP